LASALDSVLASEGVEVRVVVVDNGSEPPAMIRSDPRVNLIRNTENRGVRARNQGAAAGSADLIAIVDSDVRLNGSTLARLADVVLNAPDIGLAAPVFDGQQPTASAGRAPTLGRKLLRGVGATSAYVATRPPTNPEVWDVDFAITACVVMRRAAFDAVGGLDERYFYGPEDIDLCLRMHEAGWRVVQAANATCFHPPRRRNRHLFTRRGLQHGVAVLRHLWRHRRYGRRGSR
jgi:GT2 family glycosyltransferase